MDTRGKYKPRLNVMAFFALAIRYLFLWTDILCLFCQF